MKILKMGLEPIIIKYQMNLPEKEALDLEIDMIKIIGRNDLKLGPLLNLTDGGEGISGYKFTAETRELQSKKRKAYYENHMNRVKGENHPMWGKMGPLTGKKGKDHPAYGKVGPWTGKKGKDHPMYGKIGYWAGKKGEGTPNYGKRGEKNPNAKIWKCVSPEGDIFIVRNLREFCKEKGLGYDMMCRVGSGHQKQHRGWKCICLGREKKDG